MLGGWIGGSVRRIDGRPLFAVGLLVTAGADPDRIVDRSRDAVAYRGPRV